jgi:hypothetical protein
VIRRRLRQKTELDAQDVAELSLPLKWFSPKAANGIANASSAKIVTKHWTQSLHAMVQIVTFTVALATANGRFFSFF